jgi:hypothetical protein
LIFKSFYFIILFFSRQAEDEGRPVQQRPLVVFRRRDLVRRRLQDELGQFQRNRSFRTHEVRRRFRHQSATEGWCHGAETLHLQAEVAAKAEILDEAGCHRTGDF